MNYRFGKSFSADWKPERYYILVDELAKLLLPWNPTPLLYGTSLPFIEQVPGEVRVRKMQNTSLTSDDLEDVYDSVMRPETLHQGCATSELLGLECLGCKYGVISLTHANNQET